jgi:putative toxin-antitoxin system antitoxin component (TIGR02293 family)
MRIKKRKTAQPYPTHNEEPLFGSSLVQEPAVSLAGQPVGPMALLGVKLSAPPTANNQVFFLSVIRGGLPRHSLDTLMQASGLTIYEMAGILDTTDRTLRRHEGEVKLGREHSERLLEMAHLYSRGAEVFGSLEVFREWMNTSIPALGGQKPKAFLDTSLGINMLFQTIGRIEHGVFA